MQNKLILNFARHLKSNKVNKIFIMEQNKKI